MFDVAYGAANCRELETQARGITFSSRVRRGELAGVTAKTAQVGKEGDSYTSHTRHWKLSKHATPSPLARL